jgi:hypothetical protein
VKRWLELNSSARISTSLGWGPNTEGQHGFWERPNIVGFPMRNGPPPEMGPHVSTDHLAIGWRMIAIPLRHLILT